MDKLRFNLVGILSERYKVTLIVPVTEADSKEGIELVRRKVNRLVTVDVKGGMGAGIKFQRYLSLMLLKKPFYSMENDFAAMHKAVHELSRAEPFHFIQVLSDFSACYLGDLPDNRYKITGPVDDTIESVKGNALLIRSIKEKAGLWFLIRAVKQHFSVICRKSNLVLFHSGEDMDRVKTLLNTDVQARVLPVPTDIQEKAAAPEDITAEKSIVFVGGLGAPFNADAAERLVIKILPLIREQVADVVCYLVGNNPPQRIQNLASPGRVVVTGQVPDVRPYIRKASVYVSPIRIGTGIKTKIIEALSLSKAIVATPQSLQGLWKVDDSLLIAADERDFAAKVAGLLKDPEKVKQLGARAKLLYDQHYSPQKAKLLSLEVYEKIDLSLN
jgi:glycosyltransferase involved in cell wall biosynthesis